MTMRHLLSGQTLAIVTIGMAASAQEVEEALDMHNYRCDDYGVVQVGFADDHTVVVVDGQSHTLPYIEEQPSEMYLYAGDTLAMALDDDSLLIGPRLDWAGAIVRPTSECIWES